MFHCVREYLAERTRERFEVVVTETRRHVHCVAASLLGDAALAEDVTQDVFLTLLRGRWRPEEVRDEAGFLTSLTISVTRTRRRSKLRRASREVTMGRTPDAPAERRLALEDAMDLHDAVAELPPELRECVVLRYYGSLGTDEIAGRLGISRRAVQKKLERAHGRLRRRLGSRTATAVLPVLERRGLELPGVSRDPVSRREAGGLLHSPWSSPGSPAGGRMLPPASWRAGRWRLALPAAAGVVLLGVAAFLGILLTRQGQRAGSQVAAGALPSSVPRSPGRRLLDAGLLLRTLRARLDGIDWDGIERRLRASSPTVPLEDDDRVVCALRVVDEDGVLLRSGTLQVLTAGEPLAVEDLAPGASAGDGSEKTALLGADLAASNPATLSAGAELEGVPVIVRVLAPGRLPFQEPRLVLHRGRSEAEVVLPSRPVATVRVRDAETGDPVGGLQVSIPPDADEAGSIPESLRTVRAGAAEPGVYLFRGLGRERYDLSVQGTGILPVAVAAFRPDDDITVWTHRRPRPRTGSMLVTVFDPEGKPWPATEVVARGAGGVLRRTTDAGGQARFEDLLPGRHTFSLALASIPETAAPFVEEATILVRPGRERRLTLGSPPESERLVVALADHQGESLAGILVRIEGPRYFYARSGAGGEAVFEAIPAGAYTLSLERTGLPAWSLDGEIEVRAAAAESGGGENRRELRLGRATIRGKVHCRDPAGLYVLAASGARLAGMELGADGRFAFADAAPGRYAITVSHPDRGPLHRRTVEVEVPAEGDPPEVEVRLDGLGVLLVEVAAPDGRPVPGARAACLGPAGPVPLSRLSTGARGAEFGAQVDPGDYRVSVTAPGRLTQERLVTVGAGDEKRLKVVLP